MSASPPGRPPAEESAEALGLIAELFPLARSITGEGVRATLAALRRYAPLEIHEVPTGTRVLDWEVPREWNIRDAWIADERGRRLVDFRHSNLHVLGYSVPVRRTMTLAELRPHLHSDPARPDSIPYRTSYYTEQWGFCLSHHELEALPEGRYEVVIDSTLSDGSLSYGECTLPGESDEEVLVYTHTCHPSLANDNLSGIAVCALLMRELAASRRRYTYRFVFAPGTIGSICWLDRNEARLARLRAGLIVALVGTDTPLLYKQSRSGAAEIDRIAASFIANEAPGGSVIPYSPWGYDERQFGSPGFALPVGRLTRACEEGYPQYHSSADDLTLIDPAALAGALHAARSILRMLEANVRYRNTAPKGEPQLGRRGLYRAIGGAASPELQRALLWVLNLSDGAHDLAEIYARSGVPAELLHRSVEALQESGLLIRA